MSENMVEAIQRECNRVRGVVKLYEELPGGVGRFGAAWMKELIGRSERAIASLDVVECVACLKELREVEP
jgi:hypothetical protein